MRLRSLKIVPLLVAISVTSATVDTVVTPAVAAPRAKPEAWRKVYDEAVSTYRQENFENALAMFKRAYGIKATPEARRGIAMSLDRLGRKDEAIVEYEKFIAEATAAQADWVTAAKARVAELSKKDGKVRIVTSPPGATVEITGIQSQPTATTPLEVELTPGQHTIRARIAGHDPAESSVDVSPGGTHEVNIELTTTKNVGATTDAMALPTPTTREGVTPGRSAADSGPPLPWVAPVVTGGLAALALTGGVVWGLSAASKADDYDAKPTEHGFADAESTAALSTASFIAGGALAIATVVFVLFPPGGEPQKKAASAARTHASPSGLRFTF